MEFNKENISPITSTPYWLTSTVNSHIQLHGVLEYSNGTYIFSNQISERKILRYTGIDDIDNIELLYVPIGGELNIVIYLIGNLNRQCHAKLNVSHRMINNIINTVVTVNDGTEYYILPNSSDLDGFLKDVSLKFTMDAITKRCTILFKANAVSELLLDRHMTLDSYDKLQIVIFTKTSDCMLKIN
jgi:hypothetical protein